MGDIGRRSLPREVLVQIQKYARNNMGVLASVCSTVEEVNFMCRDGETVLFDEQIVGLVIHNPELARKWIGSKIGGIRSMKSSHLSESQFRVLLDCLAPNIVHVEAVNFAYYAAEFESLCGNLEGGTQESFCRKCRKRALVERIRTFPKLESLQMTLVSEEMMAILYQKRFFSQEICPSLNLIALDFYSWRFLADHKDHLDLSWIRHKVLVIQYVILKDRWREILRLLNLMSIDQVRVDKSITGQEDFDEFRQATEATGMTELRIN